MSSDILQNERDVKIDAYSDLVYGLACMLIYVAVVGSLFGLDIPAVSVGISLTSEVLASGSPTAGDYILMALISTYGFIWGSRISLRALTTIRRLKTISIFNSIQTPT